MASALSKLYAQSVCKGTRNYPEDVPEKFRAEVYELCKAMCKNRVEDV